MTAALYNEVDPYAARWLRRLVVAGHIAPGAIEERSIEELTPKDVAGPGQRHFFAGVGVWSHAARLAGWPDDCPLWSGSCPCQPFSDAGAGRGFDDERHLWPAWFRLIRECRPPVVVGEQVASGEGLAWLDAVHADMEGAGYAFAAFDLCAAGVGAPHRRQRLYFAAHRLADDDESRRRIVSAARVHEDGQRGDDASRRGALGGLVHPDGSDARRYAGAAVGAQGEDDSEGPQRRAGGVEPLDSGATRGFWAGAEWLECRDGKRRPTQPGLLPLVDGATARVVSVCSNCRGKTLIDEDLRFLFERHIEDEGLGSQAVLFKTLHGGSDGQDSGDGGGGTLSGAVLLQGGGLQSLWREIALAASPRRPQPDEQRAGEHRGSLPLMPQGRTPKGTSDVDVRGVWANLRREVSSRPKQNLLCGMCSRVGPHLCREEMVGRVGRLRAYGNAIVAPLAAAFLGCLRDSLTAEVES